MSTSKEPLRLSHEDLYSPQVEAYLQDQQLLRRDVAEVPPQPLLFAEAEAASKGREMGLGNGKQARFKCGH